MIYPTISEYIEAIKAAEDNFDELTNLRPVFGDDGQPVMTSGNFAVVFKMKEIETGKLYALKCFTKDQEGRGEAYRLITEELKGVDSPYLTSIRYLDKELFVDTNQSTETEFPVLLMDWVEGKTLDKYLRENLNDKYALEMLAYRFSQLAQWLIPQPFAHGDLKPDNILVREDGTLVLVDYDGMYVPAMKGQKARELGSPDFSHPQRTEDDFDEHIDDFSLVSILLSLKTVAIQPESLDNYGASGRLLFSYKDYLCINQCSLLQNLYLLKDSELSILLSIFMIVLEMKSLIGESFIIFDLRKPESFKRKTFNTEVTDYDLAYAWTDEYGVKYSKDRMRLLRGKKLDNYSIRENTQVICKKSFAWRILKSIIIPDSVISIGDFAFAYCNIEEIHLPERLITIGRGAFYKCGIARINIPNSVESIGEKAFYGCKLICIYLPNSVTSIGLDAFHDCWVSFIFPKIFIPKGTKCKFEKLLPNQKYLLVEKEDPNESKTKF